MYSSPVKSKVLSPKPLTHRRFHLVCPSASLQRRWGETVDVSTVRRWVRRCKEAEGQTRLADEMRIGRPATAVTPGNIQRVDHRGDRQVKTDELCRILSFSKGSVITIIHQRGLPKSLCTVGSKNVNRPE